MGSNRINHQSKWMNELKIKNRQDKTEQQQSTINNQQSTINNQQSTINNQQSTISKQPLFQRLHFKNLHPLAQLFWISRQREELDFSRRYRLPVDLVASKTDAMAEVFQLFCQRTKGQDVSVSAHDEDANGHHGKIEL